MNKFFELLLQNTNNILDLITFVKFCDEGYNIIRKTCGKPGKLYSKSGICFKIPIIQGFDKINMKKQIHYLHVHSNLCETTRFIPFNKSVDAQIEYRIINPYVIYKINNYDDARHGAIRTFVDNEVHLMLNRILSKEKNKEVDIQLELNEALIKRNKEHSDDFIKEAILIERIVVCAYDYSVTFKNVN